MNDWNEILFDDTESQRSDIRWMMLRVSVLIRLQECCEGLILEDNESLKKHYLVVRPIKSLKSKVKKKKLTLQILRLLT